MRTLILGILGGIFLSTASAAVFVDQIGVQELLLQPDGKVIAIGTASDGIEQQQLALARYLPSGELDASFGKGGRVFTDVSPDCEFLQGGALDSKGRIVVIGTSGLQGCQRRASKAASHAVVARYLPSGELDASFGNHGLLAPGDDGGTGRSVVVLSDDKVVVAVSGVKDGNTMTQVLRYSAEGAPDKTFGTDGAGLFSTVAGACAQNAVWRLALDAEAHALFAGGGAICRIEGASGVYYQVTKLSVDGAVVKDFGKDGTASVFAHPSGSAAATSLAVRKDGGIVIGGYSDDGSVGGLEGAFQWFYFDKNGQLPARSKFGTARPGNGLNRLNKILVDDQDRVFAIGEAHFWGRTKAEPFFTYHFGVVRLLPNHIPDFSYGPAGHNVVERAGLPASQENAYAAALQPDGKIVIAGPLWDNKNKHYGSFVLARLQANGALDTTFGDQGYVITTMAPEGKRGGELPAFDFRRASGSKLN